MHSSYRLLVLCVIGVLFGASAPVAQAIPILDQSSTSSNGGNLLSPGGTDALAQTFTVGIGGTLTSVDVLISRNPGTVSDLLFDVRATTGGGAPIANDGTTLANVTVPGASVPTSAGFFNVDISAFGLSVNPGDVLAIALRVSSGAGFNWRRQSGDPYAGGASYFRFPSAGINNWALDSCCDKGFRTFVEPAVPEPASLLLLGTGLAGLLGFGRRKRST